MPPVIRTENKYGLDWVLLNNRWYCVQNYSPTHLADGTEIPIVTDDTTWAELTTPARCVYNNNTDAEFIAKYGYLYNWFGVDEGLEMPCAGCQVPSAQEYDDLRDWLIENGFNWDGTTTGNKIAKAMASSGGEWTASDTEGHVANDQASNNSSGLTGLPGGQRNNLGGFVNFPAAGFFWSSTNRKVYCLQRNRADFFLIDTDINRGFSIRISRPRAKMFLPPQLIYQGL